MSHDDHDDHDDGAASERTADGTDDGPAARPTDASRDDDGSADAPRRPTPGKGRRPDARAIEPTAPEEFGLVQVWWGDGKGKTTAAMGMGLRAAGHGYRVHMLQFMKGGADSVEDTRGEYNAIAALPGFTYENAGHYGWHGLRDGSDEDEHAAEARAAFRRARELVDAARDVDGALPLDAPADRGVHMLVLDEVLYAVSRGLVAEADLVDLVTSKPDDLELVLTGSHDEPDYLADHADLVSEVRKHTHPIDAGRRARKGTEY
ncbi:cob(I)alamin adenosyltransferase [Halarchaeum rubridurum]|uniref:Cob(I)alamin adenosyltransferase n=1 Tax=Halarchaeum rubridurum TaxID=489911 RepID=A0A830FME7_9EURY|nr:cob(I)yrinic acid a,c-diamide adenosyltransferase [Halarchaeum rubridurum]MBP1954487.1 cob(I)alamin adenosyltransferase [Halarchaeum rubridurum]GGM61428.1 cob(I)alamin adenosyltransferase [Halarchaeum rubridurum]